MAVGRWLAKRFPERFRHNAARWDWSRLAMNSKRQVLGPDGKPIRVRWYRKGKALRPGFRPPARSLPGEYERRLSAKPAYADDFYDESDWLEHLRIQAEVYADACSTLSDLIARAGRTRSRQSPLKRGRKTPDGATQPDTTGYVSDPPDPTSYVPLAEIIAEHCESLSIVSPKQVTKLLDDFPSNAVRWTRPLSRHGSPHPQRRNVHLVDWEKFAKRLRSQLSALDSEGFPSQTPDEIEAAKAKVRGNH